MRFLLIVTLAALALGGAARAADTPASAVTSSAAPAAPMASPTVEAPAARPLPAAPSQATSSSPALEAPAPQAPSRPAPQHVYGVYGDSLGDGVWAGLYGLLRRHPEIALLRRSKIGAGLTRPDFATWLAELPQQIQADGVDVAIVMFGTNDQQGVRDERRRGHAFGSTGWRTVYAARIDAVLDVFRQHDVRVVWVGLPIMRKDESNAAADTLNALFAEGAARAGAAFVPTIEDFKGPDGQFAISLPDANQRQRLVRAEDGVHFTSYGYELLASKVLATIRQQAGENSAAAVQKAGTGGKPAAAQKGTPKGTPKDMPKDEADDAPKMLGQGGPPPPAGPAR